MKTMRILISVFVLTGALRCFAQQHLSKDSVIAMVKQRNAPSKSEPFLKFTNKTDRDAFYARPGFRTSNSTVTPTLLTMQTIASAPETYDLYVSPTGNDSNPGTKHAPLRNINTAIDRALPEQSIKVANGRYFENVYILQKKVYLTGNPSAPDSVIIDANNFEMVMFILECNPEISGFTLTGGHGGTYQGGGVLMRNASAKLSHMIITGNTCDSDGASAILVENENRTTYPEIRNSVICNNTSDYGSVVVLLASRGMTNSATLFNTTIADNTGTSTVKVMNSAYITIFNSILYNPSIFDELYLTSSAMIDMLSSNINHYTIPENHIISVYPGFVSAGHQLYQLSENSPCIDAGDSRSEYNDLYFPPARGTARSDLGAYGGGNVPQAYQTVPTAPIIPQLPQGRGATLGNNIKCSYTHSIVPQIPVTQVPESGRTPQDFNEFFVYCDGFGRSIQKVDKAASPTGNDVVTPMEYDAHGRESKKYLPYVAGTSTGEPQKNATEKQKLFYRTPPEGISGDNAAWAETIFEESPLNRIIACYQPGNEWRVNQKLATTQIHACEENTVKRWQFTVNGAWVDGYYPAKSFSCTKNFDEDGVCTTTYTDSQDRLYLQKDNENNATYYVYNEYGLLAYVLPPAMTETSFSVEQSSFKNFGYAYIYDERGRVIKKHIPGAGWTHIVYNKLDLPVLVQNAEQADKNPKEWNFTKYDVHGRVVATGLYTSAESSETLQSEVYAAAQWESRTSGADYTSNAFPTSGGTALAVNYYDNYAFPAGHPFAGAASDRPHGLPTGSKTKVLDASPEKWLYSVTCYDAKGRVSRSVERLPAGDDKDVDDETVFEYDFVGRVKQARRTITKTE